MITISSPTLWVEFTKNKQKTIYRRRELGQIPFHSEICFSPWTYVPIPHVSSSSPDPVNIVFIKVIKKKKKRKIRPPKTKNKKKQSGLSNQPWREEPRKPMYLRTKVIFTAKFRKYCTTGSLFSKSRCTYLLTSNAL